MASVERPCVSSSKGAPGSESGAGRLRALASPCRLCFHRCRAERARGQVGVCGLPAEAVLASICLHKGEEPPLCTGAGAGTVFLAGCTLRCSFCQNHQISRGREGGVLRSVEALAEDFLDLERRGAANVAFVSPTSHAAPLMEAMARARERGLTLPLVWNSNATETVDCLAALEGLVDVYLPDFKYGSSEAAARNGAAGLFEASLAAIGEMWRQVGPLEIDEEGKARRGLLLRHLVLPCDEADTAKALSVLVERFGADIPVSLMAQYHPCAEAIGHPILGRPLREGEYFAAIDAAGRAGLDRVTFQELPSRDLGLPDFLEGEPFEWEG